LIPGVRTIYVINRTEKLPVFLRGLVERNVLSVPVLNQKGKYSGYTSLYDLVCWLMDLFKNVSGVVPPTFQTIADKEAIFNISNVNDIMRFPRNKENVYPVSIGCSLMTAWEILALTGAHRLPVIDQNYNIKDIITQSMLIEFLWQNIEKIGALADNTISTFMVQTVPPPSAELGHEALHPLQEKKPPSEILTIPPQPPKTQFPVRVFQILESAKVVEGLREMVDRGVNGLAVVDASGKLVNNLSARDLRGIYAGGTYLTSFGKLWEPISTYKANLRKDFPQTPPLVYCIPTDTIRNVIQKMQSFRVHRVYVVESQESMVPISVITQTNILGLVIQQRPKEP